MRATYILLATLACLALTIDCSPIQLVQKSTDAVQAVDQTVVGRQAAAVAAPVAAAGDDEDDDDDDDEDEIEDPLDDDDDDDDEDETSGTASDDDEDEDDDLLERFFDDILGDDEDDDDDDVSPSTGVVEPAAAPVQQVASAPSAVAEDIVAADYPVNADDTLVYDDESIVDGENVQVLDNTPGDAVKEPSQQVPAIISVPAAAAAASDEEDDDDEEDDIEDALVDDDDDDDEEDDDDEDDDDDLIGDDVIEAKQARGLKDDSTPVPDILIHKYNRFVDGIFGRINKILKRSYDPVSVRLSTPETRAKGKENAKKRTVQRRKSTNKSRTANANIVKNSGTNQTAVASHLRRRRNTPSTVITAADSSNVAINVGIPDNVPVLPETRAAQRNNKKKANKKKSQKPKRGQNGGKKSVQHARGVLFGLASLKREGNVRVNALDDHTTVKSNFILGPLMLKVEKAFGRGAKRELKSATATTTEMVGRINLRIVNGAATLHSIKVQQPKQVKVDSADNHDRTREFVWKKSAHIAQVVSQKLTSAARSMLQPPPKMH